MASSKHTPGPWHDDGYRIYAPTTDADPRNGRVVVEYKHQADFNDADSRLIAAAPQMYEILQSLASRDIVWDYEFVPMEIGENIRNLLEQINGTNPDAG